jgi:hypothetical protein
MKTYLYLLATIVDHYNIGSRIASKARKNLWNHFTYDIGNVLVEWDMPIPDPFIGKVTIGPTWLLDRRDLLLLLWMMN